MIRGVSKEPQTGVWGLISGHSSILYDPNDVEKLRNPQVFTTAKDMSVLWK